MKGQRRTQPAPRRARKGRAAEKDQDRTVLAQGLDRPAPRALASLVALGLVLGLAAPGGAAYLIVPLYDAAGATDRLFAVDLETGAIDELVPRRGGLMLEVRRLGQNLFADIGRPADSPARAGELLLVGLRDRSGRTRGLLLVETTTGYAAYLQRPGQNSRLGELRTLAGRPAAALAAEAGSFALLVRRDPTHRSELAYLVRGDNGGCLLFSDLERLEEDPRVRPCTALAPLALGEGAAPIETASGTTTAFLVVEEGEGRLVALEPAPDREDRLLASRTEVVLGTLFPPAPEASARAAPRFALAAIHDGQRGTGAVVAVDAWTGRMAVLRNLEARSRLTASLLPPDLSPLLGTSVRGRSLAAIPRVSTSGRTGGLWIVAGPRAGALFVTDPDSPADLAVQRVELRE